MSKNKIEIGKPLFTIIFILCYYLLKYIKKEMSLMSKDIFDLDVKVESINETAASLYRTHDCVFKTVEYSLCKCRTDYQGCTSL